MNKEKNILSSMSEIKNKIFFVRGVQVMIDNDLALLYGVKTKALNQAVKRNLDRFPPQFCFRLTKNEFDNLRSQIVTSKEYGGRRYAPYVFTEEGVAMLSAVLKSRIAVYMSVRIISAFVEMRKILQDNAQLFTRVEILEEKQTETDKKFDQVFDALSEVETPPTQKIFFDGQIFDAHKFVSSLVRKAKKKIVLVDNYIDESVLILFNKRKRNVKVIIYCDKITPETKLDLEKYNSQYASIQIKELKLSHDRFLIIDDKETYHFGASIKDLGKKWFAFSKFNQDALILLEKLKNS